MPLREDRKADLKKDLAQQIRRKINARVRTDEPLAGHCTWRIGGPADLWVEPDSPHEFADLISLLQRHQMKFVVIGRGSNLLFPDEGIRAVVVCISRRMSRCIIQGTGVRVQAGMSVPRLALRACQAGLAGLEHAAGIPCSLGGLVAMNGGSERQNVGQCIQSVEVCDSRGRLECLEPRDCGFGYRRSIFQGGTRWVMGAHLHLVQDNPRAIRSRMKEILEERRRKFPRRPSCGSVFLSDPLLYQAWGPPGRIIEETGCKGWRAGGAQVSRKHANFIVNTDQASARDVLKLISRIENAVCDRIGHRLHCEVRYLTPEGDLLPAERACDLR